GEVQVTTVRAHRHVSCELHDALLLLDDLVRRPAAGIVHPTSELLLLHLVLLDTQNVVRGVEELVRGSMYTIGVPARRGKLVDGDSCFLLGELLLAFTVGQARRDELE